MRFYPMPMHLHAACEPSASIGAHMHWARRLGIRHLFLTEHDSRIGVKRRPSAKPDCVDELCTMEVLDEQLPRADVIFSVLPGTDATYHMYTAERFGLMKKSAVFLNCGRGGAVESAVLYEALKNGTIAAAAVDVTEPEPLPTDSPLWQLDNLLITPHISGQNHLPATFERVVNIAAENLRRYLAGEELLNVVDWETGYKK